MAAITATRTPYIANSEPQTVSWDAAGAVSLVLMHCWQANWGPGTGAGYPDYGGVDFTAEYYYGSVNQRHSWWKINDLSAQANNNLRSSWHYNTNRNAAVGVDTPFDTEQAWVKGGAELAGYNGAWIGPTLEVTAAESLLLVHMSNKYAGVNNATRDNTGVLTKLYEAWPEDRWSEAWGGVVGPGTYVCTNLQTNWPSDNNVITAVAIPLVGGGGGAQRPIIIL